MRDPDCIVNGCKAAEQDALIQQLLAENGRLEKEVDRLQNLHIQHQQFQSRLEGQLEEKEKLIADLLEGEK